VGAAWSPKAQRRPAENGFRNVVDGGLQWSVSGRSHTVSVIMMDPTGKNGAHGESSEPPNARPRWHLADGETIHLLGDGTIQIK
jgi:hypothetical protein